MRDPDRVVVTNGSKQWTQFESFEIQQTLSAPLTATFTLGDEGAWLSLAPEMQPGREWTVTVNNRPLFTGRAEIFESPADDTAGVKVNLTVRSRLSDAYVASADTALRVTDTSVKDFITGLFKPLGYTDDDFEFSQRAYVDLVTGRGKSFSSKPTDLEPLQVQQAKVQPGESIIEAATRHLERHGLVMVDAMGPRGRIAIFRPDTTVEPFYELRLKRTGTRENRQRNNIVGCSRGWDWSDVPSVFAVYGQTFGGDIAKSPIQAEVVNIQVVRAWRSTGHFNRRVVSVQNQVKTVEQAQRRANKLLTEAIRSQDTWDVTTDGLTYWTGAEIVPWCLTNIVSINADIAGGPTGNYFIAAIRQRQDETGGSTRLAAIKADLVTF